jgi:hypothetical protein
VTTIHDTVPDNFSFIGQTGVALNAVATSSIITVSGIDAATPISIKGGTYSVNGGSYNSADGIVNNGDKVTVRQTSSGSYSTETVAILTIGGVTGTFSVTTIHDTVPDGFSFIGQTGVALNTVATSNTLTVSGIDAATPISITGGKYSINGGSYTSVSGTVNNGDKVTVQQTSSGSYSTTTNAILVIGGLSGTFSVTTTHDTVPDNFSFIGQTGVALNTVITSNTITVSGIDAATPISITGGTYSINGGPYTSVSGTVNNGDKVTVHLTSSGKYFTTNTATLTIGGVSGTFSVTTKAGSIITLNPVASKTTLWPPDNKMVDVTIKANAGDSSGGSVTLTAKVSCNESAKVGTDWTTPVINQKTGVISLSLRATRLGSGTGRIYTITITATGTQGNSTTKNIYIYVLHDQSDKKVGK